MREMIMLFYLKRERERKFEIKWRKRKREFVFKKKVSQQVVRLLLDEGKDNIAASTSAKTISL